MGGVAIDILLLTLWTYAYTYNTYNLFEILGINPRMYYAVAL